MNNIVALENNLPDSLKEQFSEEAKKTKEITAGVTLGTFLPRLSIRGKEFTVVAGNQKQVIQQNYVDVIIVDARPNVSKILYNKVYDPNEDVSSPECASVNGEAPDFAPSIVDKETGKCPKNCKDCYFNQFGTALQGKGKACKDYKRLIVMFAGSESAPFNKNAPALTFDLPATSFRAPAGSSVSMFNEFVSQCARNNLPVSGVVVRLSFLPGVAFSKIVMNAVRIVTSEEYERVRELREQEEVKSALTVKYTPRTEEEDEDTVEAANISKETDWVPPASDPLPATKEETKKTKKKESSDEGSPEELAILKELEDMLG